MVHNYGKCKPTVTAAAQAKMKGVNAVRQRYAIGTTQQPPVQKLVNKG